MWVCNRSQPFKSRTHVFALSVVKKQKKQAWSPLTRMTHFDTVLLVVEQLQLSTWATEKHYWTCIYFVLATIVLWLYGCEISQRIQRIAMKLCRHSWSPLDKSYWFWWSLDISCCAIVRLFVVLIGLIVVTFGTDIHVLIRMNCNIFL